MANNIRMQRRMKHFGLGKEGLNIWGVYFLLFELRLLVELKRMKIKNVAVQTWIKNESVPFTPATQIINLSFIQFTSTSTLLLEL